jgi:hypothetical protein
MLKTIALAGIFFFASAISMSAVTSAHGTKAKSATSAPTAPQPKGFCFPSGTPC